MTVERYGSLVGPTAAQRISTFEHRFARAQATGLVELPFGYVLLQADFPDSYEHNRVVVTSPASASEILGAADEVMGGADLAHREVWIVDDQLGHEVGPAFATAGFEHEHVATMVHSGVDLGQPGHRVRSVSFDELRPALIRDWRIELPHVGADEIDQLADRTVLYPMVADSTSLAVFDNGEIAARAFLFIDHDDHIAQFENLMAHADYRNRGYARALVAEGLRRAKAAECEIAFLTADLDDWPYDWYRRLGYVETGRTHTFTKVGTDGGST